MLDFDTISKLIPNKGSLKLVMNKSDNRITMLVLPEYSKTPSNYPSGLKDNDQKDFDGIRKPLLIKVDKGSELEEKLMDIIQNYSSSQQEAVDAYLELEKITNTKIEDVRNRLKKTITKGRKGTKKEAAKEIEKDKANPPAEVNKPEEQEQSTSGDDDKNITPESNKTNNDNKSDNDLLL